MTISPATGDLMLMVGGVVSMRFTVIDALVTLLNCALKVYPDADTSVMVNVNVPEDED